MGVFHGSAMLTWVSAIFALENLKVNLKCLDLAISTLFKSIVPVNNPINLNDIVCDYVFACRAENRLLLTIHEAGVKVSEVVSEWRPGR